MSSAAAADNAEAAAAAVPPPPMAGPREEHDRWRTRTTHSQEDMMKVYREIFFAGFPATRPYRPETRPEPVPFPRDYVYNLFASYGGIDHFVYCDTRGAGSVTFDSAEAAERCYLNMHLSFLPHPRAQLARNGLYPRGAYRHDEEDDDEEEEERRRRAMWTSEEDGGELQNILLCLEYAWCCPFVNPNLLLLDELQPGEISRSLLGSFPIVDRRFRETTAEFVVVRRTRAPASEEDNAGGEEEDAKTAAAADAGGALPTMRMEGPYFPGGSVEPAVVMHSLWRVLRPAHLPPINDNNSNNNSESSNHEEYTVTVMDLWWEYYNQYIVYKTQPSASRIAEPFFTFAQRRSAVQEILQLQRQSRAESSGDAEQARTQLLRLMHDNTFHATVCHIYAHQKLRYDPSWVSLMRDVYSPRTRRAAQAWYDTLRRQDKDKIRLEATLSASILNAEAEMAWLALPLLQAAANAIDNVGLLCRVRRGEVDRDNRDVTLSKPSPHDSEDLFVAVLDTLDRNATSGSASALLSVCEDMTSFRYGEHHLGYNAVHHSGFSLRAVLDALWIPIFLIGFVVIAILYTNWRASRPAVGKAAAAPYHAKLATDL